MPLPGLCLPNQSDDDTVRQTADTLIAAQRDFIKEWTRAALDLTDDDTITVTELRCNQSGCDPREVMIAVFTTNRPGLHVQIHRPLLGVDEQTVRAVWLHHQESTVSK